jgi:hypothetical protein
VTKYRTAGDIVNKVLVAVCAAVKPGARAVDLCALGDGGVDEAMGKIYNQKKDGKKVEKGSAFPCCISVNNCVGHYSPLLSEDKVVLAEGDLVKVCSLALASRSLITGSAHTGHGMCMWGRCPCNGTRWARALLCTANPPAPLRRHADRTAAPSLPIGAGRTSPP